MIRAGALTSFAFLAALAQAQPASDTLAIVHAQAWTLTSDRPVDDATIVVRDGKIVSVAAGAAAPMDARVLDARGRRVTPGLMHPATQLGLLEVAAASETRDTNVAAGPLGAAFDVQYAINPSSALIQLARADGLTRAVTHPGGTGVVPFSGTAALLRLSPRGNVLDRAGVGVFASIGGDSSAAAGGSRAAQWQLLRTALDAAKTALAQPADATTRTPEFLALEPVLAGRIPLAISTNRASDIRQAIRLASDYSLRLVIIGGAEAWMAADELAKAHVPVIVDAQANLPSSFDALGSRLDNAALLHEAGVTVLPLVLSGIHVSYNAGLSVREGAGLAVANGLPYLEALRAITILPAQIWGLADRYGTLEPGKEADIVIWDGDPLEPSSLAQVVLVAGQEVALATHQTRLRDRYMPRAGLPAPPGPEHSER